MTSHDHPAGGDGPLARMTFDRPDVLNAGNARFVVDLDEVVAASRPR